MPCATENCGNIISLPYLRIIFFFPFGLLLFCVVQFYFGGLGQQRRMPVAAAEQKDRRHRAATGADGKAGDTPKEVSTDIWPIGGSTAPAALKDTQNVAGKKKQVFHSV